MLLYVGVVLQQRQEIAFAAPDRHRVALHLSVGVLAAGALLRQRHQHPLRVDEAAEAIEVLLHVLRVDQELVDDAGERASAKSSVTVASGRSCVRPTSAKFALVPERDVLHRGHRIGANHAGKSGQVFRQYRVSFVGVAEEPFWPPRKTLRPPELRCVQVANFVARRSTEEAMTPSVAKYIAWRSRGMICVETGSTNSPISLATYSSTRGSMFANVPTAPEMAQVATSLRAAMRRCRHDSA